MYGEAQMKALKNRLKIYEPEIIRRLQTEHRYSVMGDYPVSSIIAWDGYLDNELGQKGKGYHPIYKTKSDTESLQVNSSEEGTLLKIIDYQDKIARMDAEIIELRKQIKSLARTVIENGNGIVSKAIEEMLKI